jgi:AraC-like DNA-binding protein
MSENDPRFNTGQTNWLFDEFDARVLYVACQHLTVGEWDSDRLSNYQWRIYHDSVPGAELTVCGETNVLESDRLYIVPPHLPLASRNKIAFDQTYVHFDLTSSFSMAFRKLFPGLTEVSFSPVLKEMTDAIRERTTLKDGNDIVMNCLAKALIFQAMAERLDALTESDAHRYLDLMRRVEPVIPALKILDQSPEKTISNKTLAQKCSMSEDHFIHVFKTLIGMPPRKYQLKRRLTLAAQLLLFTQDSIDQISEKLSFNDRFYFSRMFAKETGHSPARFRQGSRS